MTPSEERLLPTYPALVRLAWPMVVSRSTQVVIGLADAAMVAHLGEDALAATTTGAMNSATFFIFALGTVLIVASFASQHAGKGDRAGARRFAYYGLAIALAAQLVTFAGMPFVDEGLRLFSFTEPVRELLAAYMRIRLLGIGAMVGIEGLASYYGGLGNTRLPMLINVGAMVGNVAGNYLLINGRLGFPALGVEGAAWASTASSGLAFLVFLLVFARMGRAEGGVLPRLHLSEFKKTLRYGLPAGFNYLFEFLAFLFFVNVVMAGLGTTALAAMMTVLQLNSFAFMPGFALASAGAILVGQAIGAGTLGDVGVALRKTLTLACAWQVLVGALYLSMPHVIFGPFVSAKSPPELLALGVKMLAISTAWQLFDAAATVLAESLRAAGDTAFTLYSRLLLSWVVFAPGAYVSVRFFGLGEAAALGWLVLYLALLAGVLFLRFRSGAWKRFELVGPGH